MKLAVVVFPGSNCDHDAYYAGKHVFGQDAGFVWHKETSLGHHKVGDVRQGKYFELDLNVGSAAEGEALANEVSRTVLANPVIESFRLELAPESKADRQ